MTTTPIIITKITQVLLKQMVDVTEFLFWNLHDLTIFMHGNHAINIYVILLGFEHAVCTVFAYIRRMLFMLFLMALLAFPFPFPFPLFILQLLGPTPNYRI